MKEGISQAQAVIAPGGNGFYAGENGAFGEAFDKAQALGGGHKALQDALAFLGVAGYFHGAGFQEQDGKFGAVGIHEHISRAKGHGRGAELAKKFLKIHTFLLKGATWHLFFLQISIHWT